MRETNDMVEYLMNQNRELMEQVEQLTKTVNDLNATIDVLNETIRELREQLGKNSGNSSKPPSSDGLKKPAKKDRSLREKSGKKPGGQKGHKGSYLNMMLEPNITEKHIHQDCQSCPHRENCMQKACVKETRRVIDAVVDVSITAHEQICMMECPLCGQSKTGSFPDTVKTSIQYGNNLEALVVAFNTVGAVSVNRTHEILGSVFHIPLSTGTIKNMVSRCAEKIKPALEKICQELKATAILHCDETGTRVDGKTRWVHNASNAQYTYLTLSEKRGYIGMVEAGILSGYTGIIVHDCWESYWKFNTAMHAVCCAHLLRGLNGIEENYPEQSWASKFKDLLLKMKKAKDNAIAMGKDSLCKSTLYAYKRQFDEILSLAYEENPLPDTSTGKRGRKKRGKVLADVVQ